MDTEQLSRAFKADIARLGDGGTVSPTEIIAAARQRDHISRVRRGVGGVVALVVAGVGAFAFTSVPAAAADWTLAAAPEQVNDRIVELVEARLPADATVTGVDLEAFAEAEPGQQDLGYGVALPRGRWNEADSWLATFELGTGATISVELAHATGETEGDPQQLCTELLADHELNVCDAGTATRQDQDVATLWREGAADRRTSDGTLWGAGELAVLYPEEVPASTRVSTQELEAQPGGDFIVFVRQTSPRGTAPALDQDDMTDIALDESLLHAE